MSDAALVEDQTTSAPSKPFTRDVVDDLRRYVLKGQSRLKRLTLLEAVGIVIAAPLAYLWLVFFLDNVIHLEVWGRIVASVLFLAVLGWLALLVRRNWKRAHLTEDEVALRIEGRTMSTVENRLINAIQLSRDPKAEDEQLRLAVVHENYAALKLMQLEQVAASTPALIRIAAAAVTILVGVGFWMYDGNRFVTTAQRILMPLADVAPIYDTVLTVSPGDVTAHAGQDVEIQIQIKGKIPTELYLLTSIGSEKSSEKVPTNESASVTHRFHAVRGSFDYAVRGNDYTTRWYKVEVPAPLTMERLKGTLTYPEYSRLPPRAIDTVSGDLEALIGTKFVGNILVNEPLEEAVLALDRAAPAAAGADKKAQAVNVDRILLKTSGDAQYSVEFNFEDVLGYQLELKSGNRQVKTSKYALRVLPDMAPTLEVSGVEPSQQILVDTVLPLAVSANDDFGLRQVGLVYRRVKLEKGKGEPKVIPIDEWQSVKQWDVEKAADREALEARYPYSLAIGGLNIAEGETIELTARAKDTDPRKKDGWSYGNPLRLAISGAGVELQLKYEQILRTEAELKSLIKAEEELHAQAEEWNRKLGPTAGLRWDDQKNLNALATAMEDLAKRQKAVRAQATNIARSMVDEAGSLKLSVSMLADTEMVRAIQALEKVSKEDGVQDKRRKLGEGRLTKQRVVGSLQEIRDIYTGFRKEWELSHMLAFVKMLGERQVAMAEASVNYSEPSATPITDAQRQSISRRQLKLLELCTLAQTAYVGMHEKADLVGPVVAESFKLASQAFDSRDVKSNMQKANEQLLKGDWKQAHPLQQQAAEGLQAIYADLRKAQTLAGKLAMDEKRGESTVEDQKPIDELKAGDAESNLDMEEAEKMDLKDIAHMRQVAAEKKKDKSKGDTTVMDYKFDESMKHMLTPARTGKTQDFNILKLATTPGKGDLSFPSTTDREKNKVKPQPQKELEDLIGKLLDEVDQDKQSYETLTLTSTAEINEPGEIGKQGGDLNSTAAAASTGNQKPPTNNFGGASRSGRQGARSYGAVVGEKSVNRRGRDKAQEGDEDAPNQKGELKEVKSEDPQEDSSTGRGGKAVGTDKTSFSTKDAGEFKEEDVDEMRAPQDTNRIVERSGGKKISADLALKMRDLTSNQEQLIERIKAVKKQLDQLYLPTDHLDDILNQLNQNLDRLKDKPDVDLFRKQVELLKQIQGTVVVFNRPTSEFEQTLKREQSVKGRILDEPAKQALPGYEEAVNRYYEKLSGL